MHRNLSCPAVSHSCRLTFLLSMQMFFVWKSTPSVEVSCGMKIPLLSLMMNDDLPTAASPTNTTLNVSSGGPVESVKLPRRWSCCEDVELDETLRLPRVSWSETFIWATELLLRSST